MPLFQRTIKLVIATCFAILLSEMIGLRYASSAGIIAILSILDTRRSSIKMAEHRLLSTLLALGIACIAYFILGFNLFALALYLACYIPLAYQWKLEAGIAPSTVLVTHLLLEKSVAVPLLLNELALFFIGAGLALLLNLYMPSRQAEIEQFHLQVEEQLKKILFRFEHFLISGNGTNDAKLILELESILQEALQLVYLDHSNHLFHQTNYQIHYFEMRKQQNAILKDMADNINHCQLNVSESQILAELFAATAQQLSQKNPGQALLDEIENTLEKFRNRSLPQTRTEFETRARLFQLLYDLQTFIQLKVDFYQEYKDEKENGTELDTRYKSSPHF